MKRRRGTSLVEVITAMTVGSVVVGLAVTTLVMLLRAQSVARDHVHQSTVLSRLAEQFRQDVRAANAIDDSNVDRWEFAMTRKRTVSYLAETDALLRLETAGGKLLRQERFSLPPGTAASIHIEKETSATIVSLIVAPAKKDNQPGPPRIARVDAPLGADNRFRKSELSPNDNVEPSSEDSNG